MEGLIRSVLPLQCCDKGKASKAGALGKDTKVFTSCTFFGECMKQTHAGSAVSLLPILSMNCLVDFDEIWYHMSVLKVARSRFIRFHAVDCSTYVYYQHIAPVKIYRIVTPTHY